MAAEAMPGGLVTADAYQRMTDPILAAVRAGSDGCLHDLHGAMVVEGTEHGDGTLLEQIRAIAPELPIAVNPHLHCILTPKLGRHGPVIARTNTSPQFTNHKGDEH